MKRVLRVTLAAVLCLCALLCAACAVNPLDKAVKIGDNSTIVCAYDSQAPCKRWKPPTVRTTALPR